MRKTTAIADGVVLALIVIGVAVLAGYSSRVLQTAQVEARLDREYGNVAELFLMLARLDAGDVAGTRTILRTRLATRIIALEEYMDSCDRSHAAQIESLFVLIRMHLEQHPPNLEDAEIEKVMRRILNRKPRGAPAEDTEAP